MKLVDRDGLSYFATKIKQMLALKSDVGHTHDRVNGYKIIISTTTPTIDDQTIITFVK